MLVTFQTDAYESITLFGEVAQRLLKMMGHSAKVPGAILAKEVPLALQNLTEAIAKEKDRGMQPQQAMLGEEEPEVISIAHRALPVIALLQAAARKECDVLWS
jgi:hypothetical protein